MPIYDYECRDCGAEVSDVFQKVTDPELKKCETCGTNGLYRVVTCGLHSFMAGSNTIGSVADRNTRENKNKINEMEAKVWMDQRFQKYCTRGSTQKPK